MKKILKYAVMCAVVLTSVVSCSKDDKEVKVVPTKVTVDPATCTLTVGDTKQLAVEVLPKEVLAKNKVITWSCVTPEIATISETGLVTAVGVGNAVITAKTTNGIKGTCNITVNLATINVTEVTIAGDAAVSIVAGSQVVLTANVLPSNATDKTIVWTSSNAAIATATLSDGKCTVVGVTAGTATITAAAGNFVAAVTLTVTPKAGPQPGDFETPTAMIGNWTGIKYNLVKIATGDVLTEEDLLNLLQEGDDGMSEADAVKWVNERRHTYNYLAKADATLEWNLELRTSPDEQPVVKEWFKAPGTLSPDEDEANLFVGLFDTSAFFTAKTNEQYIKLIGDKVQIDLDWNKDYTARITYKVTADAIARTSVKCKAIAPKYLRKL